MNWRKDKDSILRALIGFLFVVMMGLSGWLLTASVAHGKDISALQTASELNKQNTDRILQEIREDVRDIRRLFYGEN